MKKNYLDDSADKQKKSCWNPSITMGDPNFPTNLEINPSENDFGYSEVFGVKSQKSAIKKYGIAGRVW